jgi:hypothetical protein
MGRRLSWNLGGRFSRIHFNSVSLVEGIKMPRSRKPPETLEDIEALTDGELQTRWNHKNGWERRAVENDAPEVFECYLEAARRLRRLNDRQIADAAYIEGKGKAITVQYPGGEPKQIRIKKNRGSQPHLLYPWLRVSYWPISPEVLRKALRGEPFQKEVEGPETAKAILHGLFDDKIPF